MKEPFDPARAVVTSAFGECGEPCAGGRIPNFILSPITPLTSFLNCLFYNKQFRKEMHLARSLEFNEHDALTASMHAFRRLGYHGVSIKTLEAETGLSSGSIYNSFGGKDAVFERALRHYNEVVVEKRIERYLDPATPIDGLVALFVSLLEEPNNGAYGCLLTNSAIEFAGADTTATIAIREGFDRFLAAFRDVLSGLPGVGKEEVEIRSLRLLAYYQGLLVLIRHGHDKARLRRSIKSEILSITGETNV